MFSYPCISFTFFIYLTIYHYKCFCFRYYIFFSWSTFLFFLFFFQAELEVQKEIFEQTIFDMNPANIGKIRKEKNFRYELKYPELHEVRFYRFVFHCIFLFYFTVILTLFRHFLLRNIFFTEILFIFYFLCYFFIFITFLSIHLLLLSPFLSFSLSLNLTSPYLTPSRT